MLGMLLAPSLTTRTSASSVTNASLVARENLGEGWGPGSGHTRRPPPDPRDPGTPEAPSLLRDRVSPGTRRSLHRVPWRALGSVPGSLIHEAAPRGGGVGHSSWGPPPHPLLHLKKKKSLCLGGFLSRWGSLGTG